jgi:FkbM family methyltransferase
MELGFMKRAALRVISTSLKLPIRQVEKVSELYFVRKIFDELMIDCVLDVGANQGQFSTALRGIGFKGLIVSFEPIRREFIAMQDRFRRDSNWRGHQIALGSQDGVGELAIPNLTVLSSFLNPSQDDGVLGKERVSVRRLDGLWNSELADIHDRRIFLKMDTQGFDLEVFRGASGCIDKIIGLASELSIRPIYKEMPHYLDALQTYEAAGFSLYNLAVESRIGNGGLQEMNCFMRRD